MLARGQGGAIRESPAGMTLPIPLPLNVGRRLALLLLLLPGLSACGGRRPPLPEVTGALADAVVRSALAAEDGSPGPPVQPLQLDSISFARLGAAAGAAPLDHGELERQVARPFVLVDPREVLVCPSREPCRLADDGVYLEIWEAERSGAELELVVTRIQNFQGLYVMTRSVTHRLVLRADGGQWRLVRRELLPA
jgi:hypothetical protein